MGLLIIMSILEIGLSFSIARILVFGLISYTLLVLSFNKTKIFIHPPGIEVKRGPIYLPLADSYILKKEDIKRLDLCKQVSEGESRTSVTFSNKIIKKNNDILDLLDSENEDEAFEILGFIHNIFNLKTDEEKIPDKKVAEFYSSKAKSVSRIYYAVIPGSLFLNLPCCISSL